MEVPLEDGAVLLVEVDPEDVPGGLALAPAERGAGGGQGGPIVVGVAGAARAGVADCERQAGRVPPEHFTVGSG